MAKDFSLDIYERRHEVKFSYPDMQELMTKHQFERGQYYRQKYLSRKGEMGEYTEEWNMLQKMYECDRTPSHNDPNFPCNVIPLITPVVEGQVASMLESDIDYVYTSNNPAHKDALPKLEAVSEYCRLKNKAHLHYKDYARQYDLLGNGWLGILWDKSYSNDRTKPKGYPNIIVPSLGSVIVDGRIKDYKDLQNANYIIHEIGFQDIAWARREYDDEKAEAIARSLNLYDGDESNISVDDSNTFMLLHVWTRDNIKNNLQLIEMDSTGFILRESDPNKPYFKLVDNEYPFWFGRMLPRQGHFYGYGDGKILKYMQIFINNLADEMEVAARYNAQAKTFVDAERGNLDLDQWDSDPSHPIVMKNPSQNIYALQGQGISSVIPQMIQFLLDQAQRATRFSDIMTGTQQGVSATATQISGQLSQGSVGIKDKASDIQAAMQWCDRYCLRLCLEKWDIPFWVSKFKTESEPEFIDMSILAQQPAVIPATGETIARREKLHEDNPDIPVITYEQVYNDRGEPVYTTLDFDVKITLTSNFPRGKNDLFNQILSLMQIQVLDPQTQQLVPFMSTDVARSKMSEILGFTLTDKDKENLEQLQELITSAAQINPISNSGEVAMPQGSSVSTQPSNLMGTVPMANDNRGMQL